jgi:hypothetical protein
MTQTIEAAGYIIADNEGIIHGCGATADAAEADMERTMNMANITLLEDTDDTTDQLGSWTLRSGLKTYPASATLLADVEGKGGAIGWDTIRGVACTNDEAFDAQAF